MNNLSRRVFLSAVTMPLVSGQTGSPPAGQQTSELHPDYRPEARVEDLIRDLSAPLHDRPMRDRNRKALPQREADLSPGFALELTDPSAVERLAASTGDFQRFMSVCMGLRQSHAYPIRMRIGTPDGCPSHATEAFHVNVSETVCTATASDAEGLRRALVWLEDEMLIRRGPFLPLGAVSRWAVVEERITRSPVSPYLALTGWELEYNKDFYPDEYLNKLAHCGMNGIWLYGLLSRMLRTRSLPELAPDISPRPLENLRCLAAKAARYGIKVYLFCMEPRAMPRDHPVFTAHPEIQGAAGAAIRCLCVSTPLVQQYIRDAMRELFTAVPALGGIINLFNGERLTTCWWNEKHVATCPRCRERTQVDVLADDLNCFMEGMRQASTTAKFIAWDCNTTEFSMVTMPQITHRIHKDVIWMGNFEHGAHKTVDGKRVDIAEYSLSSIGPSEAHAAAARAVLGAGRRAYAKLQIGNSYELSSVPYIPVPQVVYDKLAGAQKLGTSGAMISWIIGGYPSLLLKAAGEASFAPLVPRDRALHRLAAVYWGPSQAEPVVRAWEQFSQTFQQYLCAPPVFYYGPITRCPSYQLHLEQESQIAQPYNWGMTRERKKQPYEDKVSRWLGPFTAEELIQSFRKMGDRWAQGVSILSGCMKESRNAPEFRKQLAVAAAIRLQFLSMANVLEFYTQRDRLREAPVSEHAALVRRMRAVVEDDIALAKEMKTHIAIDPALGFQSELHYYSYSEPLLEEKIARDTDTLRTLARWQKSGIEPQTLSAVLPAPVSTGRAVVTWRDYLRWGEI